MMQKKMCLLGASGVGKTSLIKQFVEGIFSEKYLTSIGVKIDKKQVPLASGMVQLLIWDLEGIDRYCGFQPKYLRGASACVIVADQTRPQSLSDGLDILKQVREVTSIPIIFVINKSDLTPTWYADDELVKAKLGEFSAIFHTSAKTGKQVEEMFTFIAQQTVQ